MPAPLVGDGIWAPIFTDKVNGPLNVTLDDGTKIYDTSVLPNQTRLPLGGSGVPVFVVDATLSDAFGGASFDGYVSVPVYPEIGGSVIAPPRGESALPRGRSVCGSVLPPLLPQAFGLASAQITAMH